MVENFLQDLFSRFQKSRIAIIIRGDIIDQNMIGSLNVLRKKLKELGDIKISECMYENSLPEGHIDKLRASGFGNKIVPGNLDLNYMLYVYDLVLSNKADIFVLGTQDESLIPLYTEIRSTSTVFAFVKNSNLSSAFKESFDQIIFLDKIDEFNFNITDYNEMANILNSTVTKLENVETTKESMDELNIGTISEVYHENVEE